MYLTNTNNSIYNNTTKKFFNTLLTKNSIMLKYLKYKIYKNSLKKNIFILKNCYSNFLDKNKSHFIQITTTKNHTILEQNFKKLLFLILKINFLNSNIMIDLTNTFGKTVFKYSAGFLKFKNAYKTKKIAINTLLKKIKFEMRKFKKNNLALHILGNRKHKKFTLSNLKNFLTIKTVKNFNLTPFNGCKTRKKKRKKIKRILKLN